MYTLYTFFKSTTAWRVRIALQLKSIKPNYQFIDLLKNQQKSQTYLQVNPNHGVPSFILPTGECLTQSLAIIQYLNQKYPQPNNLYPGNSLLRAQIRSFCQIINCGIHPYQNLRVKQRVQNQYGANSKQWCKYWTNRGLNILEKTLQNNKNSGNYCFGNQITAADILLYPQVQATTERWGANLDDYKNIKKIFNNLSKQKAFIDSAPQNQSDYYDVSKFL